MTTRLDYASSKPAQARDWRWWTATAIAWFLLINGILGLVAYGGMILYTSAATYVMRSRGQSVELDPQFYRVAALGIPVAGTLTIVGSWLFRLRRRLIQHPAQLTRET